MSKEIYIELSSPVWSYLSGQTIQGRVVVNNFSKIKVKEIAILLSGKGHVSWSESESYTDFDGKSNTRSVSYTASEQYVHQRLLLAGDGHNLMELPHGTIHYPFQFLLPQNSPSSFDSDIGSVVYCLKAELKRALLIPNNRTTLPIRVNGLFNLNLHSIAISGQRVERVKGENFLVFRSGQVRLVLTFPRRSGFVPGEILDFVAEVTNDSNKNISGITATLNQVIEFHARSNIKFKTRRITRIQGPHVEAGHKEIWTPQSLIVPLLPPTNLGGGCRIIYVQYYLAVRVHFSGVSTPLNGQLPVLIGTIPVVSAYVEPKPQQPIQQFQYSNLANYYLHNSPIADESSAPTLLEPLPPTSGFKEYTDPPPTYDEAVTSKQGDYKL